MKQIPLSRGKFALVDDEDYEFLMQWKWHANNHGYAVRSQNTKDENGVNFKSMVCMHRVLINAPKDKHVDHIDFDKLNNRKVNLRLCTLSENNRNNPKRSHNTSGYKGVYLNKRNGKWFASIGFNGRFIYIGIFKDIKDAARAYNAAAIKYHGEFAVLNEVL